MHRHLWACAAACLFTLTLMSRCMGTRAQHQTNMLPIMHDESAEAVAASALQVFGYESPIVDKDMLAKYKPKFATLPHQSFAFDDADLMAQYADKYKPLVEEAFHIDLVETNQMFGKLDQASVWAITRYHKPRTVVEIGAGFSSYVFSKAMDACRQSSRRCKSHIAIEPFRTHVLDALQDKMDVIKKPLQDVDLDFFERLQANDILFIDSSHITRPYGDVVYEFLHILPTLRPGVIVHVHDIFLPDDYPEAWMKQHRSYTEQWVLAAFLHKNHDWRVLWSSYYMAKAHIGLLPDGIGSGGSVWLQKVR